MVELVFEVLLGSIAHIIRLAYFNIRYPHPAIRAIKIKEYGNTMPWLLKLFSWLVLCVPLMLLLLLFYKLIS